LIFDWDNDGTGDNDDTEDLTNIPQGTYHLDVIYTGNNGTTCTADTTIILLDNPPAPSGIFIVTDESCFGTCNGSITSNITVGSPPLTFNWTSTNPGFTNNGSPDQFNLCSADYFLTLTDSNNCSLTDTFTISSASEIVISGNITNIICFGDSTGAISISVTGGNISTSLDYTYNWNGINTGFTSASGNISNLLADTYFLTVTDDDGCSDTSTFIVSENTDIILVTSSLDATCGNPNGEVDVAVSGGVVAVDYSYIWTNSSLVIIGTSSNITGLPAGTYTVTVTDDLGCKDSATATINDISTSTIVIDTIIHESCAGDTNGLISVIITVSPPPGSLSWTGPPGFTDPGGNNTTISNLAAGQYIATLIDGLGCQKQEVIDIIAAQTLSLSSIITDPSCFNFSDGSISIFPSGGSVAVDYQYDWDIDGIGDLDDDQDQDSLSSGSYIVFVYDDNGCFTSDTFNLNNPTELTGTANSLFAACGVNDGYVTVIASGGTIATNYNYVWIDQSSGLQIGNTDSVANLPAGCYEITVTDDNACSFIDVTCISNPTGPVITLDLITDVWCYGGQNGSIYITVSGGNPPYTYSWSNYPNNTEDVLTWFANTYAITVTDSLGCIAGDVFILPEPDSIIAYGGVITNLTCYNNSSGEINLNSLTGGNAPYNYSWTGPNGFSSSQKDLIGLDSGTYIVTQTDVHNCAFLVDSFNITQPDSIALSLTSTETACDQPTGTATAIASGGTVTLDYTYYWLNSMGDTVSMISTATNLDAGVYFAHIYDDNGCLGLDSITIVPFAGPIASLDTIIDASCAGQEDGSVFITVTGNAAPYSYNWTGTIMPDPAHQFNEDLITWFAGIYSVVVTDTNGCTDSLTGLIINQPVQLFSSISATDAFCNGDSTGSLDLTISGGNSPYQFEWSFAGIVVSTNEDPTGLGAGTYDLLVTDSNGCTITDQAVINEPSALSLSGGSINSTCGNSNGEVSVVASGGTIVTNYSYVWFNVTAGYPGTSFGSGNATETGLDAGAYQAIVSDDNGCTDSLIVTISDLSGPSITYVSSNIFCFGSTNGSITLTVIGSNPFTFFWIGPPPFSNPGTQNLNGLDPGTYTVIVTDINGCISSEAIDVTSPSGPIQVNSTITDLTCFNDASGGILIDIIGGTPPYQTTWSGPNGFTSILEDLTGLDTGQYVLDIVDNNGCSLTGSVFNVSQPDSIIIDTSIIEPTCGLADGQISVIVTGGTIVTDYTYDWDDLSTPSFNIGFTSTLTNVSAGNYQITVADDNGCTDSMVVSISDLTAPILSAIATDVDCVGDDDGTIDLTIIGTGPYLIDWDNDGVGDNDDTEDLTMLAAGTYNVIVQDLSNACIASLSVNINVANTIAISFITTDLICNSDSSGSIDATVTGGTPSYLNNWTLNGFPVSSIEDPTGLAAGNYLLTVTDDNGCIYTDSIELIEPSAITLFGASVNSTCGNANGEVSVVASGGTIASDYNYAWFDIGGGYPGSPIGSGTDDNGCVDSIAVAVSDANGPSTSITSINVLCFGDSTGAIDLIVTGNGPFTFLWSGPPSFSDPGTEDLDSLFAGSYSVEVTDINGCVTTENINIISPSSAINFNSLTTNLQCYADSSGAIDILISGGTPPYQTNWTGTGGFISTSEDLLNLDTGQYVLNITDDNGCVLNGNIFNITQPDSILITATIVNPTCNASDGQIIASVSGGTIITDYTYNWDDISTPLFGISTFASLTSIGAGNYEITVTDDNGCSNSSVYSIANVNAPTLSAVVTNVDCNGNLTGEIDLTISGTNSYTIDWDNDGVGDNDDTEDLAGLAAGTYSVIVNDLSTGCIAALSVNVLEPNILTISAILSDLTCYNDSSGNIDITVSGGSAPYLFDWDNDGTGDNDDSEDLDSLLTGSYNIIITDSNLCTVTGSYTISEPSELTVLAILGQITCFGDSTGTIDITSSGGGFPHNYQWSDNIGIISTNEDLVDLVANTYLLTLTDSAGCTKDTSFTITEPSDINIDTIITDVDCFGNQNGTVDAILTGGTGSLTPLWSIINPGGGLIPGNEDQFTLDGGVYQILVTDDNGCQDSLQITINESNSLTGSIIAQTNVSCNGLSDGSVTVQGIDGTSPYQYDIGSGNQTSGTFSGLPAGNYTVTITDDNGCQTTVPITITEPIVLTGSITAQINVSCNGLFDGSVTVTGIDGTSPYQYDIGSGNQASGTFSGLAAGSYTVTITDDNGCQTTVPVTITDPNILTGSITAQTNVTCDGLSDGSVTVEGAGGTSPYQYDIGAGIQASGTFSGLAAGNYTITITDDNGCQTTVPITITEPSVLTGSITAQTNISCNGLSDGSVTVAGAGGTSPYQYDIGSGNQTSGTFSGLSAGNYTITITDDNGCQITVPITITEPTILTGSITAQTNVSCNGLSDGTVTIAGAGGTSPYQYDIGSGNQASGTFSGLPAGNYTVTITDDNGCQITVPVTITEPTILAGFITTQTNVSCNGLSDGSVTVAGAGGTSPYQYDIGSGIQASGTFSGLTTGSYTVTITDDNGCQTTVPVIIIEPTVLTGSITAQTNVSCNGLSDGSVTVAGAGGTSPYQYDIGSGNQASGTFPGLTASNYTVTITDDNGCQTTVPVTIIEPNTIFSNGIVTNISCYDTTDGAINLTLTGGTLPYNISWTSSNPLFIDPGTEDLFGLDSGSYTISIVDNNSCIYDTTLIITKPSEIFANGISTDLICFNDSSGTITLSTNNGFPIYSWNWSGTGGFNSTSESLTALDTGTYNVTITDNNGCTKDTSFVIGSPNQMFLNISVINANCTFFDGSATANVVGGTLSVPDYIYDWDNDGTGDNDDANFIDSLAPGSYTLTVYDDNNCQVDSTIIIGITSGPLITIDSIIDPSCNGESNGEIYTSIASGTLPYTFIWNPGVSAQTEDITNIPAGTYYLQLIDSNDCTSFDTVVVQQPSPITFSATTLNANCNTCDGSATLTASGGNPTVNYSFVWSSGETGPTASSLCSGIYSVEITDTIGCSYTGEVAISDNGGPLGENVIITNPSCSGLNDGSAIVSATGGLSPYSYYWPHNGSTNSSLFNLNGEIYFVEMTDDNGCTRVAEIIISDPSEIQITPITIPASCSGSDGSISVTCTGGSGGYSYSWIGGQTTSSINNLSSGLYTLTVTDGVGCQKTEVYSLSNFNNINLELTSTDVSCYGYSDGQIISTISGAGGTVNYNWINSSGNAIGISTADLLNVSAGVYSLEITDLVTGCTQYASASIDESAPFMISFPNIIDASCSNVCNGNATVVCAGGSLPYSFDWSNGETGINADSLCVGASTVLITDNNGCSIQESVIINYAFSILSTNISLDASCGYCDGEATITPGGGSGSYTVIWYDSTIGLTHSNLCAGVYGYVVLDNNGCSLQSSVSINNTGGPDSETVVTSDVSCFNGSDGSVSVVPGGGTPPYSYLWVPGGQITNSISGLQAGTYHLEVIDNNGCIRVVPVTINQPSELVSQQVILDASCGNLDGSISLNISGGVSPFNINWIGPSGFTGVGSSISNLSSGSYITIIQDANNCYDTSLVTVNSINGPDLSIAGIDPSCFEFCDGEVSVSTSSGSGNYSYTWNNGGVNSIETGLCAGSYSVEVQDQTSGCLSSAYITITEPDSISLSTPFIVGATCNDSCNGEVSVIPSGGIVDYSFIWSPSSLSGSYLTGICAGIQNVVVTDNNGCSTSQNIQIDQPAAITISIDNITNAYCVNNADGSIAISVIGGNGNYNYSWSTYPVSSFNSTSEDINSLLPTNYVINVTDINNCVGTDTIPIDTIHVLLADAGADTANCINDCITLTGTGSGSSSFTLAWLDSNSNIISLSDTVLICSPNIGTINYILEISDQNCNHYDTISVLTNSLPLVDAGADIVELYGSLVNLGGNPVGPIGSSYLWIPLTHFVSLNDSSNSNPLIELLSLLNYTVFVTDTNGCVSSDEILVTPIPEIEYPSGFSPNSDGINEEWLIENIEEFPNCVVEIYNRWGELLFRSEGYNEKWNGDYNNKPLPVGTYYYIIELNDDKFPKPLTGPVTIMR